MNIFTKAMKMNSNMFSESILEQIITEVVASLVEVKDENVDKWNSVVDVSMLDPTELVDQFLMPTCFLLQLWRQRELFVSQ